ncbi:hypothetical protein QYF36_004321 [Acer negundo]|nr:hypothetical protein QYF36_004321 [Acer negundo]
MSLSSCLLLLLHCEVKANFDESYVGYGIWLPNAPKFQKPRSVFNAATLAYIGDCIYELYVRRHFLFSALCIEEYNDRVTAVVHCEAQSERGGRPKGLKNKIRPEIRRMLGKTTLHYVHARFKERAAESYGEIVQLCPENVEGLKTGAKEEKVDHRWSFEEMKRFGEFAEAEEKRKSFQDQRRRRRKINGFVWIIRTSQF